MLITFSTDEIVIIPTPVCPEPAADEIISTTLSTFSSFTMVMTVATLLNSAINEPVPLPALTFCLSPEPLPFPSRMVNPPTTSLIASDTAPVLSIRIVASILFVYFK